MLTEKLSPAVLQLRSAKEKRRRRRKRRRKRRRRRHSHTPATDNTKSQNKSHVEIYPMQSYTMHEREYPSSNYELSNYINYRWLSNNKRKSWQLRQPIARCISQRIQQPITHWNCWNCLQQDEIQRARFRTSNFKQISERAEAIPAYLFTPKKTLRSPPNPHKRDLLLVNKTLNQRTHRPSASVTTCLSSRNMQRTE